MTRPFGTSRIRRVVAGLAALGLAWAAVLAFVGGIDVQAFGLSFTTNEPRRPLYVGLALWGLLVWMEGAAVWRARLTRLAMAIPGVAVAATLAVAVTAFATAYATTSASASDSYGYVSQADLWIAGDLTIDQPWVAEVPWPAARATFSPLGYRPLNDDEGTTFVPTYAPGLPLLMAGAKLVAGQGAMFLVVPISAGILVLATFVLARRLAGEPAGIVASWLMAVSPAMLFMSVWPMSDVPAAAAAAVMFVGLTGSGIGAAALGGAGAAWLILIRPNLVCLLLPAVAWYGVEFLRAPRGEGGRVSRRAIVFGSIAAAGAIAVAIINWRLYGSPTTSGYSGLGEMFDRTHVLPNLGRFATWLFTSHGLLPFAGLIALLVASRAIWPFEAGRRFRPFALAGVVIVVGFYAAYLVFDEWWYLRFLLPAFPLVAVGSAAAMTAVARGGRAIVTLAVVAVVMGSGVLQIRFAARRGAPDAWSGEQRYAGAGRLVREAVPEGSVVLALRHSGSLRYYGGRMTLRFDLLDPAWLDQAVAWFEARGVRTYLLVQDYELPEFRNRFAGQRAEARLDQSELLEYEGPSVISLFDLTEPRPAGVKVRVVPESYEGLRAMLPVPMAPFLTAGAGRSGAVRR
ncbi:MAG: hypothetical protein R2752_16325 [Vicinamibacterales bacterium]